MGSETQAANSHTAINVGHFAKRSLSQVCDREPDFSFGEKCHGSAHATRLPPAIALSKHSAPASCDPHHSPTPPPPPTLKGRRRWPTLATIVPPVAVVADAIPPPRSSGARTSYEHAEESLLEPEPSPTEHATNPRNRARTCRVFATVRSFLPIRSEKTN